MLLQVLHLRCFLCCCNCQTLWRLSTHKILALLPSILVCDLVLAALRVHAQMDISNPQVSLYS